jgi:peroxiredoxin
MMTTTTTKSPHSPVRLYPVFTLALVAAAIAVAGAPPASAEAVPSILKAHNIRAVEPSVPAVDFRLPTLDGGEAALSDYEGRWVVLTFFATWCGPCRMEMPTLEKLHRASNDNPAVITISVDDTLDPVEPYVRRGGFTFPVLWDARGEAARAYKATSIPMTVLIDPLGRIAGISRGARDWAALKPMLDQLVATTPRGGDDNGRDAVYVAQSPDAGGEALPSVLHPPTAQVSVSNPTPRPGETFDLRIRMAWAGSFEEYLPHPPELYLPEGIEQGPLTASTNSQDGRNRVTYSVSLTAPKAGRYALDPVELRYTPRYEGEVVASRVEGPTVEVQAPGWSAVTLALGGLGVAAVGLLGLLVWRRREQGETGPSPAQKRHRRLQERYQEARRLRLEGNTAGYFEALVEIHRELFPQTEESRDPTLEAALERARYGGQAPPRAELDGWERRIERALQEARPDPGKARRRSLAFREETGG